MGQYYKAIVLDNNTNQEQETILAFFEACDYDNGLKLMEHSYLKNALMEAVCNEFSVGEQFEGKRLVWAGDYFNSEPDLNCNLYSLCDRNIKEIIIQKPSKKYRYILNNTTKQFVDLENLTCIEETKNFNWYIHPLSLLTCEGNGGGGGDYFGSDVEKVGTWARHSITISNEIPQDYKELIVNFKEE